MEQKNHYPLNLFCDSFYDNADIKPSFTTPFIYAFQIRCIIKALIVMAAQPTDMSCFSSALILTG